MGLLMFVLMLCSIETAHPFYYARLMYMSARQYKKSSFYLILLSAITFCLGLFMAFLIHVTVNNLNQDARIINEAGIIRGSIQRVTKLVVNDSEQATDKIITNINDIFIRFLAMENGANYQGPEKELFANIHSLKNQWLTLEQQLLRYQILPSESAKTKIIAISEICWESAVSVVLAAQRVTEEKVKKIQIIFYLLLILNSLSATLLILLVYLYVRKKLEFESSHDPLTNIYNRRSYESHIESELARSKRYNEPFSLVLFDVDNFKAINDNK